ncbi:UNVERIFIED_CONTAM: hypothetical protein Slati_4516000 [Sesamum latifolium]|uniref:Integrase zinc-binding domain-containing protein n=1 Tax=Sesamum latifolium TaxID=2727402 RepID=A0AAW2SSX1_9LAMI
MNVNFRLGDEVILATIQVKPSLKDKVKDAQTKDPYLQKMKIKVQEGKNNQFVILEDGTLVNGKRVCVPNVEELKTEIMHEAHYAPYAMHPGSTKMYRDLKPYYWWSKMKKDVAEFVARCLTCQQVKAEHQAPAGKLQPLTIPEWKWERITMDFVIGYRVHSGNMMLSGSDPSHVVRDPEIEVSENLTYIEEPIEILDRTVKKLRNKDTHGKSEME